MRLPQRNKNMGNQLKNNDLRGNYGAFRGNNPAAHGMRFEMTLLEVVL